MHLILNNYFHNSTIKLFGLIFLSIFVHGVVLSYMLDSSKVKSFNETLPLYSASALAISLVIPQMNISTEKPENTTGDLNKTTNIHTMPITNQHDTIPSVAEKLNSLATETLSLADLSFKIPPKAPRYPTPARVKKQQGTVILHALITESGELTNISIKKSSGYNILDQAALLAIRHWELMPIKKNEQTLTAWVEFPIEFMLNNTI